MYANIGLLYNRHYFSRYENKANANVALHNSILPPLSDISQYSGTHSIYLRTNYPGLLAGSGYMHEVDGDNEAYKLGFSFDFTTGVPIIPGSSIKGILRSALADWNYVVSLCDTTHSEKLLNVDGSEVIKTLFGDQDTYSSIYERIIYMDALAVQANENLLGSDYITPHKNKDGNHHLDDFSNPNPIKFLKIMPEVSFQFNFIIPKNVLIADVEVSPDTILHLFANVLADYGIGAKSNVGYGYMTINNSLEQEVDPVEIEHDTEIADYDIYRQGEVEGTIVELSGDHIVIQVGHDIFPPLSLKKFIAKADKNAKRRQNANKKHLYKKPVVGQKVRIKITNPFTPEKQEFSLIYNWY